MSVLLKSSRSAQLASFFVGHDLMAVEVPGIFYGITFLMTFLGTNMQSRRIAFILATSVTIVPCCESHVTKPCFWEDRKFGRSKLLKPLSAALREQSFCLAQLP